MTTTTSFVNEFKYSLYAYDAYFNEKTSSERAAVKSALNIPNDADSVIGDGLFGIPSYVFEELETYADVTKNKDKKTAKPGKDVSRFDFTLTPEESKQYEAYVAFLKDV